ncbi:MAG TPA: hypothetical protein VNZ52_00400 [Candidatus Thermoplasmatota archaeon]|nr:hypothetical protein [Candidatus Thermoplasmatota archaeon]
MAVNPDNLETGNVGRRAFVKGSVAAAATVAVGGTAFSIVKPLAIIKPSTAREINYIASFKVAGPAPRGIPWLPLRINDAGEIEGIPDWPAQAGVSALTSPNLDWYRYCGHENAPGLLSQTVDGTTTFPYQGDNKLRYFVTEDKILQGFNPWYKDLIGDVMRADHFKDVYTGDAGAPDAINSGAGGNWRSEGQAGANIVSVIIIKVDPKKLTFDDRVKEDVAAAVRKNVEDAQGLMAFIAFCTHFCCLPGWKEDKTARGAKGIPGQGDGTSWDLIFCTCHLSRYNPINLTQSKFVLQEATGDDAAGGAGGAAGGGH